jgi:heptosyltransferase-2
MLGRLFHDIPVPALKRILVIRLSALGDIVLMTPVLRLIRQHCPKAQIHVLVKAAYDDLLRAHPCVDHVLCVRQGQSFLETVGALRQMRYDLVIDLHRTLRSRLLYYALWSRHKLAYSKRTMRRVLLVRCGWNTLRAMTPVPELYAAPLRRLGMQTPLTPLEMHLAPGSAEAMQAHVQRVLPHDHQRPLLALAPGARWPTKRWSIARFAAVAEDLAATRGAAVVILGGAEDVSLGEALCQRLHVPVLDCTGKLSLMQTAALLQRCRLLLSNDSGLMHLATALQVPVVTIFGPTVQEFGFYPFHATAQVISTTLACRPCSTKGSARCPLGHHHCMQHVTVSEVLSAAQRLWDGQEAWHDQAAF